MESTNEIENEVNKEGIINNIPKSINISNKFIIEKKQQLIPEKKPPVKHFRRNSLIINKLRISKSPKISNDLLKKDLKDNNILVNSIVKSEDFNSITTKSTINDKLKKVTFSTIEIIRIQNYKKFNKLNSTKKIENIYYNNSENNDCIIY